MNHLELLVFTALTACLSTPSHAQLRASWESFTNESNAGSWSVFDFTPEEEGGGYYSVDWFDEENPFISFTFNQDNGLFFSSFNASTNAFHGDHAAIRTGGVDFSLRCEDHTNIDFVDVAFWSEAASDWYYSFPLTPPDSNWNWYEISLYNDTWYVWNDGWEAVEMSESILSNVDEFIIRFFPTSAAANAQYVDLDDFSTYPELIVPELNVTKAGNQFSLFFQKWDGQSYMAQKSSTGLGPGDFTDMPGALSDSGGNLTLSEVMSGRAFWQIDTQIQYNEVPPVAAP